jgi:WD40 repeat protein
MRLFVMITAIVACPLFGLCADALAKEPGFVCEFEGQKRNFHFVSFSPDGRYVVACTGRSYVNTDDHVLLYDAQTGKELRRFDDCTEQVPGGAHHVDFSPDGGRLLTVNADAISIWEVTSGKRLQQIAAPFAGRVLFSADGKKLAVFRYQSGCRCAILDAETGKEIHRFAVDDRAALPRLVDLHGSYTDQELEFDVLASKEIGRPAATGQFSPDGRYWLNKGRVQGAPAELVLLHDANGGKMIRSFQGPKASPTVMAFSPDGKRVLSGHDGPDSTLRLWDVASGQELWQARAEPYPDCVAFSPDGRYAVVGTIGGKLSLWRLPG